MTLHRILFAVRLPASGRQEQHEGKCVEIRDNELLLFIFSSCFVLIHNRFGMSPLTDGIPLFFREWHKHGSVKILGD